jgi:tetratricopeptide (TPR) repeat protein
MTGPYASLKKIRGGFLLAVFLVATAAGFTGLKIAADRILRRKVPGSSIIYIPSGKFLKYAVLGNRSLAADLIYIWAIQYYSNPAITDRFAYLDHIFSIIAELDPRWTDPYEVGSLIAGAEGQDVSLALKVLDRGFEKNPDMWLFPFEAGHIAQMQLKDFDLARKYYGKAMGLPDAPEIVKRLYANAAFKTMDYKTSWDMWLEIYQTAKDPRIKSIASNHLYQVKAAVDVKTLTEAVEKFKAKARRLPLNLNELVSARILAALPKDLDDKGYVYDPKTGGVKPPTIPWKR